VKQERGRRREGAGGRKGTDTVRPRHGSLEGRTCNEQQRNGLWENTMHIAGMA
jgi:hypothetical protein